MACLGTGETTSDVVDDDSGGVQPAGAELEKEIGGEEQAADDDDDDDDELQRAEARSEEHTSELQSRETISYAVFCLKKKKKQHKNKN